MVLALILAGTLTGFQYEPPREWQKPIAIHGAAVLADYGTSRFSDCTGEGNPITRKLGLGPALVLKFGILVGVDVALQKRGKPWQVKVLRALSLGSGAAYGVHNLTCREGR